MSPSGPATTQAQRLLEALCKFIIPFAQMQAMKDMNDITLGVEADGLITELESFILNIQHKKVDKYLQVELPASEDYLDGMDWFWNIPYAERSTVIEKVENNQEVALYGQESKDNSELRDEFIQLHQRITEIMPIRILHLEPDGLNLKISLLDRKAVYSRLFRQLQSDLSGAISIDYKYLEDWMETHVTYAILSHTWKQTPGELTYLDWQNGPLDSKDPKFQKVISFCRAAWNNHQLAFGWIDTVCINKESSSELDESIRSMYKWYENATVCITYLAETNSLSDMSCDSWFTRGWTLQELVAPGLIKFYNKDWELLIPSDDNDKEHPPLLQIIQSATKITPDELSYIRGVSISRRMELAAKRRVTREEDTAYSLMGIFDVSISTAYGEGRERAFFRLLKEIFDTNQNISDIFNWGDYICSSITSLFPLDIFCYSYRSTDPDLRPWRPIEPLTLTHLGLRTPILLMSAVLYLVVGSADVGDYHATAFVDQELYYLLRDRDFFKTMGVLNVEEDSDGNRIRIPKTCFGVFLERAEHPNSGRYRKIDTRKPIVFTLGKVGNPDDEGEDYYVVRKDELQYHGMKLVTLYL